MGRVPRLVACCVVSLSFMLMPYSTLHAHVSDLEHSHLHGGHVHDLAPDEHDVRSVDQVVQISVATTHLNPLVAWDSVDWTPVLCVLAFLALSLPFLTLILRPPARDSEPIPRRTFRHPPLRGPPVFIPEL